MSIFITAQIIGLMGYFLFISAPHFKTQSRMMQIELSAYATLFMYWYLLGQYSVCTMNVLNVVVCCCGIYAQKSEKMRANLYLLYPLGCCIILYFGHSTIVDALALMGFCFALASKSSTNVTSFRIYGAMQGLSCLSFSILTLALPAILFNGLFALSHGFKLWERHITPQHAKI